MKRLCTEMEKKILANNRKEIISGIFGIRGFGASKKNRLFNKGALEINGGTIIKISGDRDSKWILFVEDDLLDQYKKPYLIDFPANNLGNLKQGDRILVIYGPREIYVPMKINEQTKNMIPSAEPVFFSETDWAMLKRIPHPNALALDKKPNLLNEYEKEQFAKKYKRNMSKVNKIGTVLISFLILFILSILFIFLIGNEIISGFDAFKLILGAMIVGWIALTCSMKPLIQLGTKKFIEKIEYQQKVMFHYLDTYYDGEIIRNRLHVYEIEAGKLKLKAYMLQNNVKLPKNTSYGTVINKYYGDESVYFTC